MKKSLIALAVLAAAGAASAQSSVTLFGVIDVAATYGTANGNGDADRWSLTSGINATSRLGFRGTEDLGGGMSASFWLEAQLMIDDGTGAATSMNNVTTTGGSSGLVFNRRSTVSLSGGWGELRLGRDYTPQFWNLTVFDPYGTVGVGTTATLQPGFTGTTSVRASNSIGYFLPGNLGGFYGQAQYYMGENAQNGAVTEDDGNGYGVRLGFANGPFNVAIALSRTDLTTGGFETDVKQNNIAGQWDFGFGRLVAQYSKDKRGSIDAEGWLIGGLFPIGAGEIKASYSRYELDSAGDPEATKIALGYVHNLSKRTAIYTTVAQLKNDNGGIRLSATAAQPALGGAIIGAGGDKSTAVDLGIRHSF
jgi:predicted porin